jgi:hypothetical protein
MAEDPNTTAPEIYEDFDAFLKEAIHEYYRRGGKNKRTNFVALVIASGQIASMAFDSIKTGSGVKKIAIGAVSVVALRIGLRYALAGPLGIIVAGATGASLLAYFLAHRKEVSAKIGRYRELVAELRVSFEQLKSDHRDGRLSVDQRNLMVDGLLKRFLADLDG